MNPIDFSSFMIDDKYLFEINNIAAPGIKPKSYFIGINGEIYSTISNKFLNPSISYNGYFVVNLKLENGNSEIFYVHRLMMITFWFINEYKDKLINHIDGIKTNSILTNMEWCTIQENNLHAKESGLLCVGEDCPWSILTEQDVRIICEKIQNKDYYSISEIALQFNCSITTIGDIARGITWKHNSKDYNLNYDYRNRFTDKQIHFICSVFSMNRDKSFQYLYYLIIFFQDLPDDPAIRKRIYKLYKKIQTIIHILLLNIVIK